MSKEYPCIHYYDDGKCKYFSDDKVTSYCVKGPCGAQVLSNADRIRTMSDDELAEILALLTKHDLCLNPSATSCDDCLLFSFCSGCTEGDELYWLQQPAEEVQSDG